MDPKTLYREILYWRSLLEKVAGDLELMAAKESDPRWKERLAGRGKRIRRRLHEGVPEGFTASPNSPPPKFEKQD